MIRWDSDDWDAISYGWTEVQDMKEDEPAFVVKFISRDDIWAGWQDAQCITNDHPTRSAAQREVEAFHDYSVRP